MFSRPRRTALTTVAEPRAPAAGCTLLGCGALARAELLDRTQHQGWRGLNHLLAYQKSSRSRRRHCEMPPRPIGRGSRSGRQTSLLDNFREAAVGRLELNYFQSAAV